MTTARITSAIKSNTNIHHILQEINLDDLIQNLMQEKKYTISLDAYLFAKSIIENSVLNNLRPDNFCVDLTKSKSSEEISNPLGVWGKERCKAFSKLFTKFSDMAALELHQRQAKKQATNNDVQLIWLKLPKANDANRKEVNAIKKSIENHQFLETTGNEDWLTFQKYINTLKKSPITPYNRSVESVSIVIVTETEKVLLLKRAGGSGRASTWGTLTGRIEKDEDNEQTIAREVHEEINYIIGDKVAHYIGSAHTKNLGKDLAENGKTVTYADDNSAVYAVPVLEEELIKAIQLTDDENSHWKLFNRDDLENEFSTKAHYPSIHGTNVDNEEIHVAHAKALLALDAAKVNFSYIVIQKFTYPYTNSHGFFTSPQTTMQAEASFDIQGPTP